MGIILQQKDGHFQFAPLPTEQTGLQGVLKSCRKITVPWGLFRMPLEWRKSNEAVEVGQDTLWELGGK